MRPVIEYGEEAQCCAGVFPNGASRQSGHMLILDIPTLQDLLNV